MTGIPLTSHHVVFDGTEHAAEGIVCVYTTNPGMGVVRHAGYGGAIDGAEQSDVPITVRDR